MDKLKIIRELEGILTESKPSIVELHVKYENAKRNYWKMSKLRIPEADKDRALDIYMNASIKYFDARKR